ncbi:Pilus assembly protein PilP [Ferrimonas balearica DSM 9799]|uniref:Pilus assembly protein PilP n=1 Tax=Ferrimonas balearica (strain DSM 9799 / CCM 4581 / KCTC 23876 / PAT) TaxID=550540 RepID=E1SMH8_FERBD|nr:pilus assembly protein PilP [Ferrimonas balearica]ADN74533.1 Pilus assembly protein PilP [Ferrimonas balearica DSM 9799]MBW3140346.1 pilus assembly protein PilP [Ferrimonas balearica]MBW3165661.1 pilus assembly protein PilP [Ferrimonas balearica]MBY5981115.1 pilus assembly protein PilP [Ferrimonas balearica]MBY6107839.1 pilus assembly protein PilP [Ferrimonas balearica]
MRKVSLAALLLLTGCGGGMGDLREFVADVQSTPVPFNEPPVTPPEFKSVPYQVAQLRSPFQQSARSITDPVDLGRPDCPQPDNQRKRATLEAFALDSLDLKGLMQDPSHYWALLQAGDGNVYTVKEGDYLGLYHGQIADINDDGVLVTEWIPDGNGCWNQRDTRMVLARDE